MSASSPKRSKPSYKYREIHNNVSTYSAFTTNKYFSKFVIEHLGDEPMDDFAAILRIIIDRAFENARNQYRSDPYVYFVMIDGEGLDYPVTVKATKREDDNDIYMVFYLYKNLC